MRANCSVPAGPDKAAFHDYLRDFGAVNDSEALLAQFARCDELLPNADAELLALPPASTYRDAVELLLAPWSLSPRARR